MYYSAWWSESDYNKCVSWFILNEIEGKELTGETGYDAIAGALLERYPDSSIVLTLGRYGVFYKSNDGTYTHGVYDAIPLNVR